MFEAQASASDGQMNVRVLIELATVGMQGHKQAYFDIEFFGPFQQGIGGTGEPEFIGHGEGDVLPFAVGQNMLLLRNPLLGCFHATGAAAFAFTTLADVFGVRAVGRSATIAANAHGTGPAGELRSTTSLVHSGTTLPYLASN